MPATTGLTGIPLNDILNNWDGVDVERFLYHYVRHAKTHSWTDDQKAAAVISFCSPNVESRIRMFDTDGTKDWATLKKFLLDNYGCQTDYKPIRRQYETLALEPGERMSTFIDRAKFLKAKLNIRISAYNAKYATHLAAKNRVRSVTAYELFTTIFDSLKTHRLFLLLTAQVNESSNLDTLTRAVKSIEQRFSHTDTGAYSIPVPLHVPAPAIPPQANLPPRSDDAHMLRLESMVRDLQTTLHNLQQPAATRDGSEHANKQPAFLNRAQADDDMDDNRHHSIHPDRKVRFRERPDTRQARNTRDRYDGGRQRRTSQCVYCKRQGHVAYRCEDVCSKCGERHASSRCHRNRDDLQCDHCGKIGHIERACIAKRLGKPRTSRPKRRARDSVSPSRSRSPEERSRRGRRKKRDRHDKKKRGRSRSTSPSPEHKSSTTTTGRANTRTQPQAMVHAQQQPMPAFQSPMMPMYGHPQYMQHMYMPSPVPPYTPMHVYRDSNSGRSHTPSPLTPRGDLNAGTLAASLFNAAMSHAQPAPTAPPSETAAQQQATPEQAIPTSG